MSVETDSFVAELCGCYRNFYSAAVKPTPVPLSREIAGALHHLWEKKDEFLSQVFRKAIRLSGEFYETGAAQIPINFASLGFCQMVRPKKEPISHSK